MEENNVKNMGTTDWESEPERTNKQEVRTREDTKIYMFWAAFSMSWTRLITGASQR